MRLSDESIEEFRCLWEKEFEETISKEEAAIRGRELMDLYEALYRSGAKVKGPGVVEKEA